MRDILYPSAFDGIGNMVLALECERGGDYTCIGCHQPMILKRGDIKTPHFAHKFMPDECSGESVLHYTFKTLLYHHILEALNLPKPLDISWECDRCKKVHHGNLLKKAASVEIESSIEGFRPDICLFDFLGKPFAAIEVVVSHPPEEETKEFYKSRGIALLEARLEDIESLAILKSSPIPFSSGTACTEPKYYHPDCGGELKYRVQSVLWLDEERCYRCKKPSPSWLANNGLDVTLGRSPHGTRCKGYNALSRILDFYKIPYGKLGDPVCIHCGFYMHGLDFGWFCRKEPAFHVHECLKCGELVLMKNLDYFKVINRKDRVTTE